MGSTWRRACPRRRERRSSTLDFAEGAAHIARMTRRVAAFAWVLCLMMAARPVMAQRLAGGLHIGGPIRASIAGGVMFVDPHADEPRGFFALVEPGLRGGRLSLGYEVSKGNLGSYASLRASLLRTWKAEPVKDYVGGELMVLPLFAIGGRLGAFVPTNGSQRVLWMADVSLGF